MSQIYSILHPLFAEQRGGGGEFVGILRGWGVSSLVLRWGCGMVF